MAKEKRRIAPIQIIDDTERENKYELPQEMDTEKGKKTWKSYLDKISNKEYITHLQSKAKKIGIPEEYVNRARKGEKKKNNTNRLTAFTKEHIGVLNSMAAKVRTQRRTPRKVSKADRVHHLQNKAQGIKKLIREYVAHKQHRSGHTIKEYLQHKHEQGLIYDTHTRRFRRV